MTFSEGPQAWSELQGHWILKTRRPPNFSGLNVAPISGPEKAAVLNQVVNSFLEKGTIQRVDFTV